MDKNFTLFKPSESRSQANSLFWRQNLGKIGEKYVVKLLAKEGWQVIERNWRAGRYAEIDIIAYDLDKTLVFIEVKTRMANACQSGFANLGYEKLDKMKIRKLLGCAQLYLAHKCFKSMLPQGYRFDAFVLCYPPLGKGNQEKFYELLANCQPKVEHIKGFIR